MIVPYSSDEDSSDLIDPVQNLSIEIKEKVNQRSSSTISSNIQKMAKRFDSITMNSSTSSLKISSRKMKRNCSMIVRHHPYEQHSTNIFVDRSTSTSTSMSMEKSSNSETKICDESMNNFDLRFLKSFGYVEYSKKKIDEPIEDLVKEISSTIEQISSKYLKKKKKK